MKKVITILLICFIVVLGLGFLFFNYVFSALKVPSVSMSPTIMSGENIFADRTAYWKQDPKRGDIVIFIPPGELKKLMLKRIVGLPGEKLAIKDGKVLINGKILNEPEVIAKNYYEDRGQAKGGVETVIPSDSYYLLGDNSARSTDSRYLDCIPKSDIKGKAICVYYPFDKRRVIE